MVGNPSMSILSDLAGDFIAEFLDDYYAECEEHLIAARQELLYLSRLETGEVPATAAINELFRHFHSVKGLSGMVEVVKAEQIAHHIEGYLRVLRDDAAPVESQAVDLIIDSVTLLEEVIGAHRGNREQPDISEHLGRLATLSPAQTSHTGEMLPISASNAGGDAGGGPMGRAAPGVALNAPLEADPLGHAPVDPSPLADPFDLPEDVQRLFASQPADAQIWQLIFHPSPDLEKAGITVTSVRQQLQNMGRLIHAAPWIAPNQQIAFVFALTVLTAPKLPDEWANRGLQLVPIQRGLPDAAGAKPATSKGAGTESARELHADAGSATEADPADPADPMEMPTIASLVKSFGEDFGSSGKQPEANPLEKPAEDSPSGTARSERPQLGGSLMPSNMVRVDLVRLDELMRLVGELVISRARLEDNLVRVESATSTDDWRTFQEINQAMERQLRTLREAVMRVRMVPIGEVFIRMQFAALDVARNDHKKVNLEIGGQETELDKYVVERMMDPLLHLVRNAVSHGLEGPEERADQGKAEVGNLHLGARTTGDMVVITISDDGRGIEIETIEARAKQLGLLAKDEGLDSAHMLEILCAPGFSTRETADMASGRGVGMTAVYETVRELGGTLHLQTVPGEGSTFTVRLPLTLAITDALIVLVAGQRFAMPLQVIHEVVQLDTARLERFEQRELMHYRNGVLPLLRLDRFFHLPRPKESNRPVVLVVGQERKMVGLVVDRILSQREIVVRALTDPLVRSPGLAGATELGDGQVVLILDAPVLASPNTMASG